MRRPELTAGNELSSSLCLLLIQNSDEKYFCLLLDTSKEKLAGDPGVWKSLFPRG